MLLRFVSSGAALSLRSSPVPNLCFLTIHCQWALFSPSEEVNYTSHYLLAHQRGLPANAVCLAHVTTSLLTFIRVIFAAIPASGELPPALFYEQVQVCGAQELGQRKGACCLNQHVSRAENSDFGWEMQALNISVPAASKAPLCHQPWCLAPLQAAPGRGLGSHQAGVALVCRDNAGQGSCDGVTHGVLLIWWEH